MATPRVRVYIATSIDGFIAGPNHDLSWLPDADPDDPATHDTVVDPGALEYDEFIASIGALLMGRRTYDVVKGFDVEWPYGDRPVLVATHRALDSDVPATVRAVHGTIADLVEMAKEAAGDGDVYLDGGEMIRQAAEANLIDDLTLTLAPVAIGAGSPLFAGLSQHYKMEIVSHHAYRWGMLQIRARPMRSD